MFINILFDLTYRIHVKHRQAAALPSVFNIFNSTSSRPYIRPAMTNNIASLPQLFYFLETSVTLCKPCTTYNNVNTLNVNAGHTIMLLLIITKQSQTQSSYQRNNAAAKARLLAQDSIILKGSTERVLDYNA